MRRAFLLVVAVAAVVGAMGVVVDPLASVESAPAGAAGDLQLSSDGSQWGAAIQEPLFDPAVRWVPGDVRTSTFFVRGGVADQGDLTVDVVREQQDALRETGYLAIEARADGGDWTSIDTGRTHRLVAADELEGGRPVPVDVRVRLEPQATNQTMVLSTDLDLRITAGAADASAVSGDRATADSLRTEPSWIPVLGLLLLGAAALAATRRPLRPPHDRTAA